MNTLGIDIETYSGTSLLKSGLYKYIEDDDFDILLIGYSIDGTEPIVLDLFEDDVPEWFETALLDSKVLKTAFNAAFEIQCLQKYLDFKLDASQWECTMVKASMLGYPLSLDAVASAMKLAEKKSAAGKALIKYFSEPCKPTKSGLLRERNYPPHDLSKWEAFKDYCKMDVTVEQAISSRIKFFKFPPLEKDFWLLDQKINSEGVMLDSHLAKQAITLNSLTFIKLMDRAKEITGIDNPNSNAQLKKWLDEQAGMDVGKMTKENVKELLKEDHPDHVKELLGIRQELAKSSIKKYVAMMACVCEDERIRGLLQFYGANKTGRWSARLVQLHNLPRNTMANLELARNLVLTGDLESLQMLFGNIPDTMSQLIRTAFVAPAGKQLLISDFAAIEARVTAWFAGEEWRMEIFRGHGMIYEASGAQMFNVPIESVVGELRLKAKIAELALGFQGSVGAMETMGALKMGLKQDDLLPLVNLYRKTNPNIVKLWDSVNNATIQAIKNPGQTVRLKYLKFLVKHKTLFIQLPSGRFLSYVDPTLKVNRFNRTGIAYWGVDQITKKWMRQETYGGKLVENIVQGTARDILANAMVNLDEAGFKIVMHVHDEIIMEVDFEDDIIEQCDNIMSREAEWAPGLPLAAKSFVSPFYLKD